MKGTLRQIVRGKESLRRVVGAVDRQPDKYQYEVNSERESGPQGRS